MPKKKTGQRKKADKGKERQKVIRSGKIDLIDHPSNAIMVCDSCNQNQRNRAFCYFCDTVQRLPTCCHCGKQKCSARSGNCLIKHKLTHVTGLAMVGAVCDYCEAWVCHSAKCIGAHGCECPMMDSMCIECERTLDEHGGRIFICAFCQRRLCEDDQFEHQASCQRLDAEDYKCPSCNRIGTNTCLRCKVTYCDEHAKRKGVKYDRAKAIPCPRCGHDLTDSYNFNVSTRSYEYGRQTGEQADSIGYTTQTATLPSSDDSDSDNHASDSDSSANSQLSSTGIPDTFQQITISN